MSPDATAAAAPTTTLPTYAELASQLSPRHRRIVEEYPLDWNGVAAKRAGFKGKDGWLRLTVSKVLALPAVRAAIDAIFRELAESAQLRAEALPLEEGVRPLTTRLEQRSV